MTETRRTTQSAFAAALAAIVIGAALGVFGTVRVYSNDARIAETYAAKSELAGILGSITDAETGQRGFVITGDPSYLQPYTDGVAQIEQTLTTLDAMLRDNPAQLASLSLLRSALRKSCRSSHSPSSFAEPTASTPPSGLSGPMAAGRPWIASERLSRRWIARKTSGSRPEAAPWPAAFVWQSRSSW
jgi:hypothetical protein